MSKVLKVQLLESDLDNIRIVRQSSPDQTVGENFVNVPVLDEGFVMTMNADVALRFAHRLALAASRMGVS